MAEMLIMPEAEPESKEKPVAAPECGLRAVVTPRGSGFCELYAPGLSSYVALIVALMGLISCKSVVEDTYIFMPSIGATMVVEPEARGDVLELPDGIIEYDDKAIDPNMPGRKGMVTQSYEHTFEPGDGFEESVGTEEKSGVLRFCASSEKGVVSVSIVGMFKLHTDDTGESIRFDRSEEVSIGPEGKYFSIELGGLSSEAGYTGEALDFMIGVIADEGSGPFRLNIEGVRVYGADKVPDIEGDEILQVESVELELVEEGWGVEVDGIVSRGLGCRVY
jgi:hypothetical protein